MILLENPLPIFAVGAILATLCGLVFLSRRNLASLIAFATVVVLTLLLLVLERNVVTSREEVEAALVTLIDAVESNDVAAVVPLIDPASTKVLSDAETLMPLVKVEDTGATAVEVEVDESANDLTATSRCKGKLHGTHIRSGVTVFFFDQVDMHWVKRDGRWLLQDFVAYQKGKPLKAVESLRGRRPQPVTR